MRALVMKGDRLVSCIPFGHLSSFSCVSFEGTGGWCPTSVVRPYGPFTLACIWWQLSSRKCEHTWHLFKYHWLCMCDLAAESSILEFLAGRKIHASVNSTAVEMSCGVPDTLTSFIVLWSDISDNLVMSVRFPLMSFEISCMWLWPLGATSTASTGEFASREIPYVLNVSANCKDSHKQNMKAITATVQHWQLGGTVPNQRMNKGQVQSLLSLSAVVSNVCGSDMFREGTAQKEGGSWVPRWRNILSLKALQLRRQINK